MNLDINWLPKVYQAGYDIGRLAPEIETRRDEIEHSKMGIVVEWLIPYFQKKKWIKKASEAVDKYRQNSFKNQNKEGGTSGTGNKKSKN